MRDLCNKIKALSSLFAFGLGLAALAAKPTVTSVAAQQRYPWNGLVDVVVTINGEEGDVAKATCTFAATNSASKTAMAISHVTQVGTDSGSGNTWTRRFVWDTNADLGEVKIADVELVAEIEAVDNPCGSGGVQLWEDGPYWAECNVGATKPEECGLYFWWGDVVGNTGAGDWFERRNCSTDRKTEGELRSLGYIDSTGHLTAAHDAATVHLGAPWRMPTAAELSALISNCDTAWISRGGVNGRLVTGRGAYALRSIFFPAAGSGYASYLFNPGSRGYYWSSTPSSDGSDRAWCIDFGSDRFRQFDFLRYHGRTVRPVR